MADILSKKFCRVTGTLDQRMEELMTDLDSNLLATNMIINTKSSRTKYRLTLDGSNLKSLLSPGPNLLQDLVQFLLCFRVKPISVQLDLWEAFFSIAVNRKDTPLMSFCTGILKNTDR